MYAVVESGGKQYRVELGSEIEVESLSAEPGETIEFERVLLVAGDDETAVGMPLVDGAKVSADVVRHGRGDKIVVFKYQPKARRRVKHGHRQDLTVLRVSDIVLGGRSAAKQAEGERAEREKAEAAAARDAERQAAADRALAEKLALEAEAAKAEKGEAKAPAGKSAVAGKTTKAAARESDAKGKAVGKPEGKAEAKPKAKATTTGARKSTASSGSGTASRRVQAPKPDASTARGSKTSSTSKTSAPKTRASKSDDKSDSTKDS